MAEVGNAWFDEYSWPPTNPGVTLAGIERLIETLKNPPPHEPVIILSPAQLQQGFDRQMKEWAESQRVEQRKKAEAVPVHWAVRRVIGNL